MIPQRALSVAGPSFEAPAPCLCSLCSHWPSISAFLPSMAGFPICDTNVTESGIRIRETGPVEGLRVVT